MSINGIAKKLASVTPDGAEEFLRSELAYELIRSQAQKHIPDSHHHVNVACLKRVFRMIVGYEYNEH